MQCLARVGKAVCRVGQVPVDLATLHAVEHERHAGRRTFFALTGPVGIFGEQFRQGLAVELLDFALGLAGATAATASACNWDDNWYRTPVEEILPYLVKPEQVTQIATQLDVSEAEVISMNQRMAGNDRSLNVPLSRDGEGSGEWQDWLEDDSEDQETTFAEHEEFSARKRLMLEAMQGLNEREQRILQARRLAEPPLTLEDLASEFGVSRERIRQIEVRAFEKLQKAVRDKAEEMKLLPSEEGELLPA